MAIKQPSVCRAKGCEAEQHPGLDGHCIRCYNLFVKDKQNIEVMQSMVSILLDIKNGVEETKNRIEDLNQRLAGSSVAVTNSSEAKKISSKTSTFIPSTNISNLNIEKQVSTLNRDLTGIASKLKDINDA